MIAPQRDVPDLDASAITKVTLPERTIVNGERKRTLVAETPGARPHRSVFVIASVAT